METLNLADVNPSDIQTAVAPEQMAQAAPLKLDDIHPGDIEYVSGSADEAKYGTPLEQTKETLAGVARGLTLGGSDVALTKLGFMDPEAEMKRRKVNPITSEASQLLGNTALGALSGGVAPRVIGALGPGVGASALGYGAEGAILGAGNVVTDAALGDPDLTAQKALAQIGFGAAIGAGIGAISGKYFPHEAHAEATSLTNTVEDTIAEDHASAKTAKALLESEAPGPTSKDFLEAADRNGWPVAPGMGTQNPWKQKAADSLLNGAPTYSAIKVKGDYANAFNAVKDSLEGVVGEGRYTKAELGNVFKDSLTSQISEESAPIGKMYDTIKQYTQDIPLSQKSAPAIARNILELPEVRISPSSPESKLAQRVADEIGNLTNVDDVKAYKSVLNRSLSPTASSGEKRMAAILSEKLTNLEEGSIERFASQNAPSPEIKNMIESLITERKIANETYKPFITKVKTLAEQLGKGKVYGAQDAINFIKDLTPEEVTQKLFSKNNSEFLTFFEKNFPEQAALMREYQKDVLRDAAMKTGEFSPKVLFNKVNSLEPEIQRGIFHPDELQKLQDAETYIRQGFPKNYNPSGTSGMSAFRAFFEHPLGAAVGNARDFAIENYLKYADSLPSHARMNPIEAGADLANRFNKLNALQNISYRVTEGIHNQAKSIFTAGATSAYGNQSSSDREFEKRTKRIQQLAESPEMISDLMAKHTDGFIDVAPNVSQGVHNAIAAGVSFLNSKIPRAMNPLPLSSEFKASPAQIRKFNMYYNAVEKPLSALSQVKNGTLNSETMEALREVHPHLLSEMQKKVLEHMNPEAKLKYSTKISLSKFLGHPLAESLTPQSVIANQMAMTPSAPEMNAGPAKKPKKAALDKWDLSGRAQTRTQELEADAKE